MFDIIWQIESQIQSMNQVKYFICGIMVNGKVRGRPNVAICNWCSNDVHILFIYLSEHDYLLVNVAVVVVIAVYDCYCRCVRQLSASVICWFLMSGSEMNDYAITVARYSPVHLLNITYVSNILHIFGTIKIRVAKKTTPQQSIVR